jgi:4-aminobutyrate aminotransferase-like enzyme
MGMGIFVYTGVVSHLIITPPLIVNREQLDQCLRVLDEALAVSDQEADAES